MAKKARRNGRDRSQLKEPLLVIVNEDEGIEALIVQYGEEKFHVVLHDMDADEYFPYIHVYPTFERALAKAEQIASGEGSVGGVRL